MTDRVRVGVIGTGGIAVLRHLPAYQICAAEGTAEIVAVCDAVEASARKAAEQFGVPRVMTDYRELLALPNLDAVSICTPNAYHEPIALAALAAGKHVMCEKPLALNLAEAQRMAEAARQAGTKAAVNFRYRWIPAAAFVRDLIAAGDLGEIYHVYADYFNGTLVDPTTPMQWRELRSQAGSGVLGDLGSHLIDLCRFWIGEFTQVVGHTRTFVEERPRAGGGTGRVDVDDAVTIVARFASGAEAVLNASRYAPGRSNHQRVEICGSKGSLIYGIERWDRGADSVQICLGAAQARQEGFATVPVPPRYLSRTPDHPMIDFVHAIVAKTMPSPDFDDGVRVQEVLEAVELSARAETPVQIASLSA